MITEQEALDALARVIATADGETVPAVVRQYTHHAKTVRHFLRDNPDVARALGIGSEIDPRQGGCSTCGHPASAHEPPDGMAEGYCVRCADDGLGIECEGWTP